MVVLASWGSFSLASNMQELQMQPEQVLCSVITIGSVLPGGESLKTTCLLKMMLVSILEKE